MVKRLVVLKKPKFFIPLIIVLLVLAGLFSAIHNLNSPAEGTVTTQLDQPTQPATDQAAQKTYSDNYISFKYPSAYAVQPPPQKSSLYLDTIEFASVQPRDKFIALSLIKEALANDSGMNYRKAHPELYKLVSSAPASAVYSKLDNTEYSGFIAHNDKVLSVSFTSVAAQDFSSDYERIAGSLQWKQ